MIKVNNKGFAISTMLYGLLIVIVLVMGMIMSIMAFNRKNSREFSTTTVEDLEKETLVKPEESAVSLQFEDSNKTKYYRTLASALQWLSPGKSATITFTKDIEENITLTKAVVVTFNLKECQFRGRINIESKEAKVTINAETSDDRTGSILGGSIYNEGTIILNKVNNFNSIDNKGTLSINEGEYISYGMGDNVFINNTGTATITNATVTSSTNMVIQNTNKLTINGGKFSTNATLGVIVKTTDEQNDLTVANATLSYSGSSTAITANNSKNVSIENTNIYTTGNGIEFSGNYSGAFIGLKSVTIAKDEKDNPLTGTAISNNISDGKNLYIAYSKILGKVQGNAFAVSKTDNENEYMVCSYNNAITHSKIWTTDETNAKEFEITSEKDSYNNPIYSSKFNISDSYNSYKGTYSVKFINRVVKENTSTEENTNESGTTDSEPVTEDQELGAFTFDIN